MSKPYKSLVFNPSNNYSLWLQNSHNLKMLVNLNNQQAHDLINAISILNQYDYIDKKFEESIQNYKQFISTLDNLKNINEKANRFAFIEINRVFKNYLNSWKLFIDFTEMDINKKFGKKSEEYLAYKNILSKFFDIESDFVYRFFQRLRNYAEHYSFPIQILHSTDDIIEPLFEKEILENDDFFPPKHFLKDTRRYNHIFPVYPIALRSLQILKSVKGEFLKVEKEKNTEVANNILQLLNDLGDPSNEYLIHQIETNGDDKFQKIEGELAKSLLKDLGD